MTQREDFEKWAAREGYPLELERYDDVHCDPRTHAAWWAWQACASEHAELLRQAVEALADTSAKLSACRLVVNDPSARMQMTDSCKAADATLSLLRQHLEEKR